LRREWNSFEGQREAHRNAIAPFAGYGLISSAVGVGGTFSTLDFFLAQTA
jgi:hypothetical protein